MGRTHMYICLVCMYIKCVYAIKVAITKHSGIILLRGCRGKKHMAVFVCGTVAVAIRFRAHFWTHM